VLLSELPELKEARDKLARKLHKRRGRDYLTAVTEANSVVLGAYRKTQAGAQSRRQHPPKPAKKSRRREARESLIREVTRQAASRAVTEALAGRSAAPATRPVYEMDESELAEAIGAAMTPGMKSPSWVREMAPLPAAPAAQPVGAAGKPLHELDWESADDVIAAGLTDYGRQAGLVSPFWAGPRG
jgi:hypothetical protein